MEMTKCRVQNAECRIVIFLFDILHSTLDIH